MQVRIFLVHTCNFWCCTAVYDFSMRICVKNLSLHRAISVSQGSKPRLSLESLTRRRVLSARGWKKQITFWLGLMVLSVSLLSRHLRA
jgi:hypothetical protein